jgi:cold shock CspA family protein
MPDDKTQPDVFVHQSAIQAEGFRTLEENERVSYETSTSDKGLQASSVSMEDGKPFVRNRTSPSSFQSRDSRGPRRDGMGRPQRSPPRDDAGN